MSRKDDPVFNVKFVQLVEAHPCLWNSTLPSYSKKDDVQKAWQEVANETKEAVRTCRERWRTIRSSFLRSLKMARSSTGRGKRKYYLSKYLQFLIPYTKTRLKNGPLGTLRPSKCSVTMPPMTSIAHMPLPAPTLSKCLLAAQQQQQQQQQQQLSSEDTKDSNASEVAIAEEDVLVSLHEGAQLQRVLQPTAIIKTELDLYQAHQPLSERARDAAVSAGLAAGMCGGAPTTSTNNTYNNLNNNNNNNNNNNSNNTNHTATINSNNDNCMQQSNVPSATASATTANAPHGPSVDLTEFAEWIKSKNEHQRHCLMSHPDADQSFLNSLHPFLREMSGKQNRRFRQQVIGLIDAILETAE